jgi:hypothetical protein
MSDAPKFLVHTPDATGEATATGSAMASATHAEGSGVIKAGENMVGVTHGLAGRPDITLHFDDGHKPVDFSYVILVGTAFQVNLESPVTEDTPFTWTADL